MAGMVNDSQVAQVGMSTTEQSDKEENSQQDQQEQAVSCEEGSCCDTQEKSESGQTPNIAQALAATPVHTQSTSKPVTVSQLINAWTDNKDKVDDGRQWPAHMPKFTLGYMGCLFCAIGVALELCWYCLKSLPIEDHNIPQLQAESEDLALPPSGERLHYQRDPRPHFGVAHSSRSVSFPLWDSDRPREMKKGEEEDEEEEAMETVSCCPHCHLGLPPDTLRWHEASTEE